MTSLPLKLFGLRINEGTGGGSAIIATPDGLQNSYAVGDTVQPGVFLKSVAFDHVVIDRGGQEERIFLDQSKGATAASSASAPGASDMADGAPALSPRMQDGRITGLSVVSDGAGMNAAALKSGDVITAINGRAVGAADDAGVLRSALVPGARLSVMIERGARTIPVVVEVPR